MYIESIPKELSMGKGFWRIVYAGLSLFMWVVGSGFVDLIGCGGAERGFFSLFSLFGRGWMWLERWEKSMVFR